MDILSEVKSLLSGYYSNNIDSVFIPETSVFDVVSLVCNSSSEIKLFVLNQGDINDNKLVNSLLSANSLRNVESRIVYNNIKQLKSDQEHILDVLSQTLNTSFILLSTTKVEYIKALFSFILFDERFALVLEHDTDGGYYITTSPDTINDCLSLWSIESINLDDSTALFLQEPLMFSADMMSEISSVFCSGDHMNTNNCYWYHSTWQYLRLLNMVSTPTWHHSFYTNKLNEIFSTIENPNVLISGCADYSTLSYAIKASKALHKESTFSVLDMCKTPLFVCEWYAKRENTSIKTIQSNILDFNSNQDFNIIITDAFLTRFKREELDKILAIWNKALVVGGYIITTVRVHDNNHICPESPSIEDINAFKNKALERSKLWGEFINYEPTELAERAATYAKSMKSNNLGKKEDILASFSNAGFNVCYCDDVDIEGELYYSRYLRICARKD